MPMSKKTHPMFLELAVRKLALPEQLNEILAELRREQENTNRRQLEIARIGDGNAPENQSLLRELHHQKEQSQERIEALEFQRSRQAFFEGLREAATAETTGSRLHADVKNKGRRRKRATSLTTREKIIRKAIRAGKTGREYATYLDQEQLRPPEKWIGDKNNPCPSTYPSAYNDRYWRELIHKEKSRVQARLK